MVYNKLLQQSIEAERVGKDYRYSSDDQLVLKEMLSRVNRTLGTNYHYLAEIDAFDIRGAGIIYAQYIHKIQSESVRGYLLPQLVSDCIKDCDRLLLELYYHFRQSDEYISAPDTPSPAHIYVRYDNGFRILKPKRLATELAQLVRNPRDAAYLPFTVKMLASWRRPELRELLLAWLHPETITGLNHGIADNLESHYPLTEFLQRQLLFTALAGLKYYPSNEIKKSLEPFTENADPSIRVAALKTLRSM